MRKDPDETYSLKEKLAVAAVLLLPVALAVVAMIGEKRHLREVEAMKSRSVRYYEYAIRPGGYGSEPSGRSAGKVVV